MKEREREKEKGRKTERCLEYPELPIPISRERERERGRKKETYFTVFFGVSRIDYPKKLNLRKEREGEREIGVSRIGYPEKLNLWRERER